MWDDQITTTNDKERWIYECITTSSCTATSDNATTSMKVDKDDSGDVAMKSEETTTDNLLLETFTSQQNWGLTQRHGGPCGVLAAIQAEMIRVLLWGKKRRQQSNGGRTLDYPYSPSNLETQHYTPPTSSEVDEAMAMAIAMILARASIIPAASSEKRSASCTVRLVFPNGDGIHNITQPAAAAAATINSSEQETNAQSPWIEEMLSSSSNSASSYSKHSGLSIFSIVATTSSSSSAKMGTNDTAAAADEGAAACASSLM